MGRMGWDKREVEVQMETEAERGMEMGMEHGSMGWGRKGREWHGRNGDGNRKAIGCDGTR